VKAKLLQKSHDLTTDTEKRAVETQDVMCMANATLKDTAHLRSAKIG